MRSRAVVRGVALGLVAGGVALWAPQASADHSIVELVSTGPTDSHTGTDASFGGATPDGSHVFFQTDESLVAEDDDGGQQDVYERTGGATRLVSVGLADPPLTPFGAQYAGASADGSHVFFETNESASPLDDDGGEMDVYERFAGQTLLVSTGPTASNAPAHSSFDAVSTDGTRVVFTSGEALTADDTDDAFDVYERSAGVTTLLSSGQASNQASFEGASADASVVFFSTSERVLPADTDDSYDIYRRANGQTTLRTVGTTGGDGAFDVERGAVSTDGTRLLFTTDEQLVAADTDAATDLYLDDDGELELVSGGTTDEPPLFRRSNPEINTILLTTTEALLPSDTDAENDMYAWRDGVLSLESTGPLDTGHVGFIQPEFVSADGSRILFRAFTPLTADDTDNADDLYLRFQGQTTKLSPGNGPFGVNFSRASLDASRVFFTTNEKLGPGDTDSSRDVYETTATGTSQISPGNGAFLPTVTGVTPSGSHLFYDTLEPVLPADTDSLFDVYAAIVAAPHAAAPPSVTGTPAPGQTLTCSPGSWSDAESFAYQWNRDGVAIAAATSPTYVVQAGDAGHALTCTVTATGDGGTTVATSAARDRGGAPGTGRGRRHGRSAPRSVREPTLRDLCGRQPAGDRGRRPAPRARRGRPHRRVRCRRLPRGRTRSRHAPRGFGHGLPERRRRGRPPRGGSPGRPAEGRGRRRRPRGRTWRRPLRRRRRRRRDQRPRPARREDPVRGGRGHRDGGPQRRARRLRAPDRLGRAQPSLENAASNAASGGSKARSADELEGLGRAEEAVHAGVLPLDRDRARRSRSC